VTLPVDSYSDQDFFANQVFVDSDMMPEARFPNLGEKRDFLRPKFLSNGVKSKGGTAASVENSKIPALSDGWAGAKVWTNEWYTTRTGTHHSLYHQTNQGAINHCFTNFCIKILERTLLLNSHSLSKQLQDNSFNRFVKAIAPKRSNANLQRYNTQTARA
jgi:hypothetical protein